MRRGGGGGGSAISRMRKVDASVTGTQDSVGCIFQVEYWTTRTWGANIGFLKGDEDDFSANMRARVSGTSQYLYF